MTLTDYLLAKVLHLNSRQIFLVTGAFTGVTALGIARFLWPQFVGMVKGAFQGGEEATTVETTGFCAEAE